MGAAEQLDLFGDLAPQSPAAQGPGRAAPGASAPRAGEPFPGGHAFSVPPAGTPRSPTPSTASPPSARPPLAKPVSQPPPTPPHPATPPRPLARSPGQAVPTPRPATLPLNARWREVATAQQTIGFVLRRSRRKSIGLTVDEDGLQVTAPNWVTLTQIDAAVAEKASWILGKLRTRQARQAQQAMANTQWAQGGTLAYMGVRITLALDGTRSSPTFAGDVFAPREGDLLTLPLPADADSGRVRDSAQAWLQQQALVWFDQRLQHFLSANGLTVRRWRISSAATRWGSCSSDGNIMLNWRLIHFTPDVIDYVIAHEIAHLRQLNHSSAFWQEVARILPGFEKARDKLKQHDPASLPLI